SAEWPGLRSPSKGRHRHGWLRAPLSPSLRRESTRPATRSSPPAARPLTERQAQTATAVRSLEPPTARAEPSSSPRQETGSAGEERDVRRCPRYPPRRL